MSPQRCTTTCFEARQAQRPKHTLAFLDLGLGIEPSSRQPTHVHGVVVLQEPLEELAAEFHQHGFRNLEAGLERRVWLAGS